MAEILGLQSEEVQTDPPKFAPTLVLKWYPQDHWPGEVV